ncbi:MAG TPA: MFS transporter [Lacipirellulaceae bacterium]|jgi:Na+/melibiose symporter-like transporter|nr:MFS transporter [Lacipirellulaceae bacterium]
MATEPQKLSVVEKCGYSLGDAAANFVFMTMVLFQANFYTDVMGIAVGTAGWLLLVPRVWDAFFDPLMGIMADRTRTRWGRYRPWILATALPWGIVMFLAYRAPDGWSSGAIIAYALVTNLLLMTLYSANNMPYAALSGVMTGDSHERTSLNAYRFVAVNLAQLVVTGFTLPLVAKFAAAYGEGARARAVGWEMTMGLWAVVCFVFFLITFATTRERIVPDDRHRPSVGQAFADLFANRPWMVMFAMTLVHFAILSFRGRAFYDYYHNYADPRSMFDWLAGFGLTAPPVAPGAPAPGGLLEFLGWVAHGDLANLAGTNAADVTQSIIGVTEKLVFIVMILLSPKLSDRFGKKAVAVCGFAGMTVISGLWYFVEPQQIGVMLGLTVLGAIAYGPTIPVIWSIYADVADFSEWKTGRNATSVVFATICFALKTGLGLGSFLVLQLLGWYGYVAGQTQSAESLHGIKLTASVFPTAMFLICTMLLTFYGINKRFNSQIASELATRRSEA